MPAELVPLLQSLRRVLWRHGHIAGERLQHAIDAEGNHQVSLALRRDEVCWEPPPVRAKPLNSLGPRVPGLSGGPSGETPTRTETIGGPKK
jgi:hypothetical protein